MARGSPCLCNRVLTWRGESIQDSICTGIVFVRVCVFGSNGLLKGKKIRGWGNWKGQFWPSHLIETMSGYSRWPWRLAAYSSPGSRRSMGSSQNVRSQWLRSVGRNTVLLAHILSGSVQAKTPDAVTGWKQCLVRMSSNWRVKGVRVWTITRRRFAVHPSFLPEHFERTSLSCTVPSGILSLVTPDSLSCSCHILRW